ncbi:MAG: hypothetical protein WAV72_04530 [Bradyrhizobium sp.]
MIKTAQFWSIFSTCTASTSTLVASDTQALSGMSRFATIITALGGAERKLTGVVLNEIHPAAVSRQRDKQYA